jgi:formiminotetrahydrofolate cyclodeaminase
VETFAEYLERLSSSSPTPGGGSAATMAAALASATLAMVARITAQSPRHAEKHEAAQRIVERAERLREALVRAGRRDEEAFAAVMATRGEERQRALQLAAEEPLSAMRLELDVQRLASDALTLEHPHLRSDVGAAAELAAAALAASAYSVRVNHRAMKDADAVERQAREMEQLERESAALLDAVRSVARS